MLPVDASSSTGRPRVEHRHIATRVTFLEQPKKGNIQKMYPNRTPRAPQNIKNNVSNWARGPPESRSPCPTLMEKCTPNRTPGSPQIKKMLRNGPWDRQNRNLRAALLWMAELSAHTVGYEFIFGLGTRKCTPTPPPGGAPAREPHWPQGPLPM